MPVDFSDHDFYKEFKNLYSYLWDDICSKFNEYKRMDEGLVKKGFPKRYFFPEPNVFLEEISIQIINRIRANHAQEEYILLEEERCKNREKLLQKCQEKIIKNQETQNKNLEYIQEVNPQYSNYFIDEYFSLKHRKPEDVTARYVILQEASKYKCIGTVKFLHKVNSSERNFNLRHFAFLTLQKFGIKEVSLRKNRKGKKTLGDNLAPVKIETPSDLLKHIYISQLEKKKEYDLFLSHSSLDKDLILKLKSTLNSLNLNIYVDWLNDQESLKRELTNVDTAGVIIERLKLCKALIFIYTDDSLKSLWTPWEIGYFHALNRKVCVFFSDSVDQNKIPAFIKIYPKVTLENGNLEIINKDKKQNLIDWLKM